VFYLAYGHYCPSLPLIQPAASIKKKNDDWFKPSHSGWSARSPAAFHISSTIISHTHTHTHTHFYSLSEEQMEAVASHNSYKFRFDSVKTSQFSPFGFWCTLRVKNGEQRYRQCVHPKSLKIYPLLISRSINTFLEGDLVRSWRNKKI